MCTQIFLLDNGAEGRGTASVDSWKEDLQWARRLDYGWDLRKVKLVCPPACFRKIVLIAQNSIMSGLETGFHMRLDASRYQEGHIL